MAFGMRRGKPTEISVKSFGEDRIYKVYPLSALEVDQIRREYPPPVPPKVEGPDGQPMLDAFNADYIRQKDAWDTMVMMIRLTRQLRDEEWGTENLADRAKLLMGEHTEHELLTLAKAAFRVGTGEVSADKVEQAQEELRPFASASPATEPTGNE